MTNQDPTLKARVEPADARTTKRDRPVHQRDLSRLAEPIAVPDGSIDRPAGMMVAAQEVVDFFFEHALQARLHLLTNKRLARRPRRP